MITFSQLIRNPRIQKPPRIRCTRFFGNPIKKGRVEKILWQVAPKKPNSAKRKIAYVKLVNGWHVRAKIPGQGFNIQKFTEVLVRGGRVRDLPGIHYILIKGGMGLYKTSKTEIYRPNNFTCTERFIVNRDFLNLVIQVLEVKGLKKFF